VAARLDENLVELPDNRIADQLANGLDNLAGKTEGAEKFALGRHGTHLQIRDGVCFRHAVPVAGDVV
jgi:hypothetical protein